MDIIQALVAADGVHIRHQALAGVEIIPLEGVALPFGQGVDDLTLRADGGDVKADRALVAVEIIIQARGFFYKKRGGDTLEIERMAQIALEISLNKLNRALCFIDCQRILIAGRNITLVHIHAFFRRINYA